MINVKAWQHKYYNKDGFYRASGNIAPFGCALSFSRVTGKHPEW
jgi:hypothetical protein